MRREPRRNTIGPSFLDQHALERLNRRNVQRERELSRLIEIAAGRLRTRHEELDRHTSKRNPKGAELEDSRHEDQGIPAGNDWSVSDRRGRGCERVRCRTIVVSRAGWLFMRCLLCAPYTAHIVSDIRGNTRYEPSVSDGASLALAEGSHRAGSNSHLRRDNR